MLYRNFMNCKIFPVSKILSVYFEFIYFPNTPLQERPIYFPSYIEVLHWKYVDSQTKNLVQKTLLAFFNVILYFANIWTLYEMW